MAQMLRAYVLRVEEILKESLISIDKHGQTIRDGVRGDSRLKTRIDQLKFLHMELGNKIGLIEECKKECPDTNDF